MKQIPVALAVMLCASSAFADFGPDWDTNYAGHSLTEWVKLQCGADGDKCPAGCAGSAPYTENCGDAFGEGFCCDTSSITEPSYWDNCDNPNAPGCRLFIYNDYYDDHFISVRATNDDDLWSGRRVELVGPDHCENSDTCDNAEGISEIYYWTTTVSYEWPTGTPPAGGDTYAVFFQFHTALESSDGCSAFSGYNQPLGIGIDAQVVGGVRRWVIGARFCEGDDGGTCVNPHEYATTVQTIHKYTFAVAVKWHRTSGFLKVWMDGTQIIDHTGKTLWNWKTDCHPNGTNESAIAYDWKHGLYHGTATEMDGAVLHHGEMHVRDGCNETPLATWTGNPNVCNGWPNW